VDLLSYEEPFRLDSIPEWEKRLGMRRVTLPEGSMPNLFEEFRAVDIERHAGDVSVVRTALASLPADRIAADPVLSAFLDATTVTAERVGG
jgi:hypothetical protein